ncbi:MAG TPA: PQQ-dependent sugar dehydrogenase [Polyangiaceae bacterium]|nr:PQQ-dependent sugar dehydrogenase [Polyangiaceae bacterium]
MVRLSKTSLALVRFSPIALMIAFAACGNSGDPDPSGSGGSVGPGSGGSGNGSGGTSGSSGGSANGTGGRNASSGGNDNQGSGGDADGAGGGSNGTGGGNPNFDGVPGAEGYDCSAASGEVPALKATKVATVANAMVLAHEPDGEANRFYVLDGEGKVMLVKDGTVSTFLDFSSKVYAALSPGDETGALGMAFHPDYKTNGLFYVHYNEGAGSTADSIIEEYKVSADADVADPASARLVIKVDQPTSKNHKGGAINFGKDGNLYIGLGDGGGAGDQSGNGQNVTVLLAKILRINPLKDGESAYTVPAGNLKDDMASAAPEIWDYGLRNPFRSTFDGCTGDFYIGDVGQDRREELDVENAGEGWHNYGWNITEGKGCYSAGSAAEITDCDRSGKTEPVHDYDRQTGTSITGGAVYRGAAIPGLRGTYFFADYMPTTKIWSTVYDRVAKTVSTPVRRQDVEEGVTKVTSITNGADGELYITSLDKGVFKIEAE